MAVNTAPTSTYRLQIRAEFGFDDVTEISGYLDRLGVSHAYLSPILQATPGSSHGYDVVDHHQLSAEAGGLAGFQRMIAALRTRGLLAIADIVPNHMAVPTPLRLNAALWAVLRDGPDSEFARWFDVDWSVQANAILMPVLGNRIGQVLSDGELSVDRSGDEPVLRYFDHEFPIRPGTDDLALPDLLAKQWYRLAWWRVADDELNYRRFFDVDTLAAVRVEDPVVFDATHTLIEQLVLDGSLTGLRIDHPDGLADPRAYLRQLAAATDGTWVAVEKILEGEETLPTDWACAGTTGYDALNQVSGLFIDPSGAAPLNTVLDHFTGGAPTVDAVIEDSKRLVIDHILNTEVRRLVDLLQEICHADLYLRDHTRRALREAVTELLVAMDRYRAYVVPGEPAPDEARTTIHRAAAIAREQLPEESLDTLDLVCDLVLDGPAAGKDSRRAELVVRFQQACGPVMAKGLEDTTFYRWHRLISLNEVGADPGRFGITAEDFHAYATRIARDWPGTMTTLTTHDTKRSEDTRARLTGLAELPLEWSNVVRHLHELSSRHRSPDGWPDAETEYLFWQTVVATWPAGGRAAVTGSAVTGSAYADRITEYLSKATREAKLHTSWTSPDPDYDAAVADYARAVLAEPAVLEQLDAFCTELAEPFRVAVLGQKLVQLTMPGVADVYQGTEIIDLSLVDPDNRRPVDYGRRSRLLTLLDDERPVQETLDAMPAGDRQDAEKLLVTSRTLRLRRDHPDWFVGGRYTPVATSSGNAIAFGRGPVDPVAESVDLLAAESDSSSIDSAGVGSARVDSTGVDSAGVDSAGVASAPVRAITVATRLPVALSRHGGWGEHTVTLPPGDWTDVFTGHRFAGGSAQLADLLTDLPVALLVLSS